MNDSGNSQHVLAQVASDSELSERETQTLLRAWQEELRRDRWDAAFAGLVSGLRVE